MEKKHLKRILIAVNLIIAVYIAVQTAALMILGREYTFSVAEMNGSDPCPASEVTAVSEDENIIRITAIEDRDGEAYMTLQGVEAGKTQVIISAGEITSYVSFRVSGTGLITCLYNANFPHYRLCMLLIILTFAAIIAALIIGFLRLQKEVGFSYTSIFCCGISIWLSVITALLTYCLLNNNFMYSTYEVLKDGDFYFVLLTSPVLFLFAAALAHSNIILIKHEGFTPHNMLGIFLGILMFGGLAALLFTENRMHSENMLTYQLMLTGLDLVYVAYALLECFLVGAIICGLHAARHEPDYDKDYIIILGCRIRSDGTLYPLIRGRADRAIAFYRKQLEKTGKKAVLIPSGGKGSDEPIAEGQAIAAYLREQGIPEEQIRIEDQSRNTKENMLFSKAIIDRENPEAKTAFSTTNFHVFRSGLIARENDFMPDGMGSKTKWYFWPNAYIREVVGMITYQWKSLIAIAVPIVAFEVIVRIWLL